MDLANLFETDPDLQDWFHQQIPLLPILIRLKHQLAKVICHARQIDD